MLLTLLTLLRLLLCLQFLYSRVSKYSTSILQSSFLIFNYISHLHNCTLIFCFLFCFPWSSAPIFVSARTNKRQQGHERRCSSRALLRALSVAGVQMRIAGEFIETYGHRGSNSGPRDDALPNLTHPACDWAAHSDRRRASELC